MIRLAHTGDLHPNANATFAGKLVIDQQTGKNQALTDLRNSLAFVRETATAGETRCDALLIGGDVFDSVKPTMDEVQVILEWVELMADSMPVAIIAGNHDMGLSGNMATALEPLKHRDNIFLMERPESLLLKLNGQYVRICGLPYPQKGRLLAMEQHKDKSPEEILALINQGLAAILRGFTLEIEPGIPTVLLAHGSVGNAKVGVQPRSLSQDILIPLSECAAFEYVALNHVHAHQQIASNAWYSGSLMRNGFGEEHEPKGFNVVEIEAGQDPRVTFVENPHARLFKTITLVDRRGDAVEGPFSLGELAWQHVSPEHVYRIKDCVPPDTYEQHTALIEQWTADHPLTQLDIEIVQEDRARDAGMAQCLTMEEALTRALAGHVDETDQAVILGKHRRLVEELAA